jgi:hypothetical protein
MAIHDQIPPEQWQLLCAAPWAVGLYVATSVGGKVQEVRELLVLGAALHRALERDYENDLIGAISATVLRESPIGSKSGLRSDDRPAILGAVAAVGELTTTLLDGRVFRHWLMELAREVATAEEDGGWLGIGAETMHIAEQAALAELAEALGLLDDPGGR